jgi:uncharacterized membrane protein YccC
MQTDEEDAVVHLTLPRWLRRELKRAAADADSTMRDIARRALAEYVDRARREREGADL